MSARRQQIIEAVATRLRTISTGAGYLTAAGAKVRVNPDKDTSAVDESDCPGITVRETGGSEGAGMAGENFGVLELDVTAHDILTEGDDPDTSARQICVDLATAIGTDKTFDGLADDAILTDYQFSATQRGKRVASITQRLRLHYRTARWAPATAPA